MKYTLQQRPFFYNDSLIRAIIIQNHDEQNYLSVWLVARDIELALGYNDLSKRFTERHKFDFLITNGDSVLNPQVPVRRMRIVSLHKVVRELSSLREYNFQYWLFDFVVKYLRENYNPHFLPTDEVSLQDYLTTVEFVQEKRTDNELKQAIFHFLDPEDESLEEESIEEEEEPECPQDDFFQKLEVFTKHYETTIQSLLRQNAQLVDQFSIYEDHIKQYKAEISELEALVENKNVLLENGELQIDSYQHTIKSLCNQLAECRQHIDELIEERDSLIELRDKTAAAKRRKIK